MESFSVYINILIIFPGEDEEERHKFGKFYVLLYGIFLLIKCETNFTDNI